MKLQPPPGFIDTDSSMRCEPHHTHEAEPGKLSGKENCPSPVGDKSGRMPKRKRRPSSSGGEDKSAAKAESFSSGPPVEGDEVIEPRGTDVLFGRGDNINRYAS